MGQVFKGKAFSPLRKSGVYIMVKGELPQDLLD